MRNIENIIDSVLTDWACNSENGCPTLDENSIGFLYTSLISNGLIEEDAMGITNIIAEKGKYPERQAYNKNGLLVTFPTPEYKARAIQKGTHFEKNPKVSQSNLFGGGQQAPQQPTQGVAPTTQQGSAMDAGSSALPASDTGKPEEKPQEPGTSDTPPAPAPTAGGSGGVTTTPAQGQLATEPLQQPTVPANVAPPPQPKPVPPVQKTPEEIAAEKEVIKQILDTGDTLPTVPGIGENNVTEQLKKLHDIAVELKLNEAIKILSKLL